MQDASDAGSWWARGLLFENCNCQTVCPGHVHFQQLCTHERCVGYWAIRFDEGRIEGTDIAGVKSLIAYESPQHMIDGEWVQGIVIDQSASPSQRAGVEKLLTGGLGGPWELLARFVSRRHETRYLPIQIEDNGSSKRVVVEGLVDGTIEAIRGRDRSRPVTFENMFNQIHATTQVIATGSTRYTGESLLFETDGTHGLYSEFSWKP